MSIEVVLVREKETKNKVRFQEAGDQELLGTVYVPKATLQSLGNPTRLSIKLDAAPQQLQAAA